MQLKISPQVDGYIYSQYSRLSPAWLELGSGPGYVLLEMLLKVGHVSQDVPPQFVFKPTFY